MDTLQKALDQEISKLPALFLEKLISNKLRAQGVKETEELSADLAKHVLSGDSRPFRKGRGRRKNVKLTINEADVDEISGKLNSFCETQLPEMLPELASRVAKSVLKDLKSRWLNEQALQETDLSDFRKGMEQRWGKPLGKLRMLLTMSREWCQNTYHRENSRKSKKKQQFPMLLLRLLVRGCQVTDEIICLLENGFADGAMARWRTLHEIAVIAAVIWQHGESIAERYIAHQAVESKRAMDKYLACCGQLGYKPLPGGEQKKITNAYDAVIARYGRAFRSDYGWAALHLKTERPTFADLEVAAGRAEMRSYCQMANDNLHAGIKSLYVRLGLVGDDKGLLSGRSNAGLCEPGQNAAHTLTQLSVLVCLSKPNMDDLVIANMLTTLRNEIPRCFYLADKQLLRDHKRMTAIDRS